MVVSTHFVDLLYIHIPTLTLDTTFMGGYYIFYSECLLDIFILIAHNNLYPLRRYTYQRLTISIRSAIFIMKVYRRLHPLWRLTCWCHRCGKRATKLQNKSNILHMTTHFTKLIIIRLNAHFLNSGSGPQYFLSLSLRNINIEVNSFLSLIKER